MYVYIFNIYIYIHTYIHTYIWSNYSDLTRSFGPQKVAFRKGNPRLFQRNLGWWIIVIWICMYVIYFYVHKAQIINIHMHNLDWTWGFSSHIVFTRGSGYIILHTTNSIIENGSIQLPLRESVWYMTFLFEAHHVSFQRNKLDFSTWKTVCATQTSPQVGIPKAHI